MNGRLCWLESIRVHKRLPPAKLGYVWHTAHRHTQYIRVIQLVVIMWSSTLLVKIWANFLILKEIGVEKRTCESILADMLPLLHVLWSRKYFWLCGSEISFLCDYQPTIDIMDGNFHVYMYTYQLRWLVDKLGLREEWGLSNLWYKYNIWPALLIRVSL